MFIGNIFVREAVIHLILLPAVQVVNRLNVIQRFFYFFKNSGYKSIFVISIKIRWLEQHTFSVKNEILLLVM